VIDYKNFKKRKMSLSVVYSSSDLLIERRDCNCPKPYYVQICTEEYPQWHLLRYQDSETNESVALKCMNSKENASDHLFHHLTLPSVLERLNRFDPSEEELLMMVQQTVDNMMQMMPDGTTVHEGLLMLGNVYPIVSEDGMSCRIAYDYTFASVYHGPLTKKSTRRGHSRMFVDKNGLVFFVRRMEETSE